jgi:hypothetical protein
VCDWRAASEETGIGTIATGVTKDFESEWSVLFHETTVGIKGEVQTSKDGAADMLSGWPYLYSSNIEDNLSRLERGGLRKNAGWRPATQHEGVVFIGMIYAARQINHQGK